MRDGEKINQINEISANESLEIAETVKNMISEAAMNKFRADLDRIAKTFDEKFFKHELVMNDAEDKLSELIKSSATVVRAKNEMAVMADDITSRLSNHSVKLL